MVDRLLDLLKERSFERREVTLSSGKSSDWFIDCKQAVLSAEGHSLVGERLLGAIDTLDGVPIAVAGVELGGCSLASAVSLRSHDALHRRERAGSLDAVYVRKTAKEHGSQRALEGHSHLPAGASVVVVEDVVTTGGSTLRAVAQLRASGFKVIGVVAIVDRGESGGREALEAAGLQVRNLFSRSDFMGTARG